MYCQLAYICGCIPARIQHALAELPETLDETYQRTLREINEADWEFAHRLFQFVSVASRPLLVEELAELFAFDFKAGSIPKFDEDLRMEDPVDAVLSTCSSLLAVVGVGGSSVIQFSHFSVKEFLTSTRLADASNVIHRRYHVSMTTAHTLASQACLGTLLHLDKDIITLDSLKDYPLAKYAAEYWVFHAQFEGVSQNVEDGMKQLFDPRKHYLMVCIWICDPEGPWMKDHYNPRHQRPSQTTGSPLYYAAFWGLDFIVHFLVTELSQDVHSRSVIFDATPLHPASKNGHKQVVFFLLEHGADVSAQNESGKTPLHLASREGHVDVTRMLIEHGADVSAQEKDGRIPLHLASLRGHVEVVRKLIERGADVSAQDKDDDTPLHLASYRGHVEVTHMLIENGADVSARDKHGETPLHQSSRWGHVKVVDMLIEGGADVQAQDKYGKTPLHMALQEGHVKVAHMLIERSPDILAQDGDGRTPLHMASLVGHVKAALMFFERGAGVSEQDKYGRTPLHLASFGGHVNVALMLFERGVDVSAQDENGRTPLHLASLRGHVEVSHMLIERDTDTFSPGRGREDTITSGVASGTCESRSHAYRARRRCFSPGP